MPYLSSCILWEKNILLPRPNAKNSLIILFPIQCKVRGSLLQEGLAPSWRKAPTYHKIRAQSKFPSPFWGLLRNAKEEVWLLVFYFLVSSVFFLAYILARPVTFDLLPLISQLVVLSVLCLLLFIIISFSVPYGLLWLTFTLWVVFLLCGVLWCICRL